MIATISWRQMHKTIIFCLNLARQLQTNNEQTRTQNRPTCWQLASEVDPHGPSCAVPSGLRFWLAVDHRTNDSSSVCGICEAYYISTRCESLYPKCNRISSNKSMNMTPYSPMYLDGSAILLTCQRTVWPSWLKISPCVTTKIMWRHFDKMISVCDKLSISSNYIPRITTVATIFWYEFTIVLPVDCAIKSGPRVCGKLTYDLFLLYFYIIPLISS